MTNEIADYVKVKLASPFDPASDTTIDVLATNSIYEMVDQKTTSVFQDFRLSIFEKADIAQKITVGITSAVANGTLGGLNRYTLTILDSDSSNSMIGLANTDDGTDADANIIATNVSDLTITEFSTDSVCMIKVGSAEYNEMKTTFDAGNTFNTVTEGEALADTESVSLHTDGKTYLYHATNYPNLVGIQTATTGKYITFGGLSTGHSGLTVGAVQYAEDTGAVTETPSSTTKYLGVAETATSIRVAPSTPNALELASQAEAEAGTENTKYTSSLRVKQATTADTTLVHTSGAQTVAGVKTFSSSPIVPAGATGTDAITAADVDTKVSAVNTYPQNIYVADIASNPNNAVTHTHSLGVSEADVIIGRYKVIFLFGGQQDGDTNDGRYWNLVHSWNSGTPTTGLVYWQANTVEYYQGSFTQDGKIVIQQMY